MYNCKDYTLTALRAIHKESIIRTLKGLLLSLLLHLLILLLFTQNWKNLTMEPPRGKDKKISLNLQQMVTPPAPKPKPVPPTPKPKPKPKPKPIPVVPPPTPKPIVKKPVEPKPEVQPIKRKSLDESKKVFAQQSTEENNLTKVVPKPIEKKVEKKVKKKKVAKKKVPKKVEKKRVVKKTQPKRQPKRSNDPLANMLMGSGTSMYPSKPKPSRPSSSGSYGQRMINQLYGEEFNTYTSTQKKFIKNNLGTIHRITQNTLTRNGYPETAVRTRQQGTNIVSFYLHPNGDISDLKLKRYIGHQSLDQNTLDVIRTAYKDYPLPNKKTKIIFYVKYSIY